MTSRKLALPIVPTIRAAETIPTIITASSINLNSEVVTFGYPLIVLNQLSQNANSEVGLQVYRGPNLPMVQLVWSDADQTFKSGVIGSESRIPTVSDSANGILTFSGSQFSTAPNSAVLEAADQSIAINSSPQFDNVGLNHITTAGVQVSMPTSQGPTGSVLTNDGSGALNWVMPASAGHNQVPGGGAAGTVLINDGAGNINWEFANNIRNNLTKIETLNQQIITTVDNTLVQTTTANGTEFLKPIKFKNGLSLPITNVTSAAYIVVSQDMIIAYKGSSDCVVTLPVIELNEGRWLLITNLTGFMVTIVPSAGNTIDGSIDPLILTSTGETTTVIADGTNNWMTL